MNRHNSFVLGALVAIAGVAVGAGSVLYASMSVAYNGADPSTLKNSVNPRSQQENLTRSDVRRREAGTLGIPSFRDRYDLTVEEEEDLQQSAPVLSPDDLRRRCVRSLDKNSIRFRHCILEAAEGIEYQIHQRAR